METRKNIVDAFIVRSKNRNISFRNFSKKEVWRVSVFSSGFILILGGSYYKDQGQS